MGARRVDGSHRRPRRTSERRRWSALRRLQASLRAAFDRGRIYLAGGDDSFYALNAETLETVWKTKLGDNSPAGGYYGWCSPSAFGGQVFQGISSHCDDPFIGGRVVGMEGASGSIFAAADLSQTSDPARFGAGVWTSPALDLDVRTVFVTTASAYAYDDGLAYSIVRLSLDDLAIEDSWKIPLDDYNAVPDADWGSSPTLFQDAGGRLLVGASQKDGQYYAFDARTSPGVPSEDADCRRCDVRPAATNISTAAFDGTSLRGRRPAGRATQFPARSPFWIPLPGGRSDVLAPARAALALISYANGVVPVTAGTWCLAPDAATGELIWWIGTSRPLRGRCHLGWPNFLRRHGGQSLRFRVSGRRVERSEEPAVACGPRAVHRFVRNLPRGFRYAGRRHQPAGSFPSRSSGTGSGFGACRGTPPTGMWIGAGGSFLSIDPSRTPERSRLRGRGRARR